MNKRQITLLEKAFSAEIDFALFGRNHLGIIQSKSKVAQQLADDGYLRAVKRKYGAPIPVTVEGYVITDAGRWAYCDTCR